MCADAGLSIDDAAQLLHVTPRTIRYWFSGKTMVPYSAYKLLRIQCRFELPGANWAGWHMHSGRLWSPEGHGFDPHDSNWWSLLVRQARSFRILYDRENAFHQAIQAGGRSDATAPGMRQRPQSGSVEAVPAGEAGRAPQAPRPNLFIEHFTTKVVRDSAKGPAYRGESQKWTGQSLKDKIPHGEKQGVKP